MAAESDKSPASQPVFGCRQEILDLFDALPNVMFCMKGTDDRYVAVNQAFVRRSGRQSRRDVVGTRASDLFP
jgi:hypothetical protein